MTVDSPSFARLSARTLRFTLGLPRDLRVSPDGSRVVFLRSPSGTDRGTCLWTLDLPHGGERLIVDPKQLLSRDDEQLSPEERARRERSREGASGIVGYATDEDVRLAVFALSGTAYVVDLRGSGPATALPTETPVVDPRLDPTGQHVAYVSGGALRVVGVDGTGDRAVAEPDGVDVTWGLAEFIAAEEMGRSRGYWWSPDGDALLAARVDVSRVQRWHIADPARPDVGPVEVAYPAAGTPNAAVSLALLDLDGARVDVQWPADALPYLAAVHWSEHGAPLLLVQSRDQRRTQVLSVDTMTGSTDVLYEDTDPVWLEIVPGVPRWTPGGKLLRAVDHDGARRLLADDQVVSGDLQLRGVAAVDETGVLFTASADEPTEVHVFRAGTDGLRQLTERPGVHAATASGSVTVVASSDLESYGRTTRVLRNGEEVARIGACAEIPPVLPRVTVLRAGSREVRTALLLPTGHEPGSRKLPVLMDPYGGPHAQRVLSARSSYLEPQWWSDQGFAVVVADGRGTPGRGPAWERAVAFDLAAPALEDQVEALQAAAGVCSDLDLSRVAIRGWSFGGYLAALAVLRRPDIFHAAVAGAPVTDWRLYDTHYTERYLGHPDDNPDAYARSSIIADAEKLERPLLLIHGLADDNVVAAHTLRLSSALLAAGRPHTVLPLSGVTHMTPQEVVAENLLLLQLDFLRRALDL
jgi:dipeptidyl-peptidase-4